MRFFFFLPFYHHKIQNISDRGSNCIVLYLIDMAKIMPMYCKSNFRQEKSKLREMFWQKGTSVGNIVCYPGQSTGHTVNSFQIRATFPKNNANCRVCVESSVASLQRDIQYWPPCDMSEGAFFFMSILLYLVSILSAALKALNYMFWDALLKTWLDLNPLLIIKHSTQAQILQTFTGSCPYMSWFASWSSESSHTYSHSKPCLLIYWTLHAPELPISHIAFEGRGTLLLLSARLSLTVII